MLHGVVGKGRAQTLRFVFWKDVKLQEIYSFSELLSQRTKADLGCNVQPRDEDDKDFIVAFPAEQERQYDNLGGARSFLRPYEYKYLQIQIQM